MGCSGCGGERIEDVMRELMPGAGVAVAPSPFLNLPPQISRRIESVLSSWVGTPFASGQRVRGGGVDCVQLVAAVLDELAGIKPPTAIPRHRVAMHGQRHAFPMVRALRRAHRATVVRDGSYEPGDIAVVRSELQDNAAPNLGHPIILGVRPKTALSAGMESQTGVTWVSLAQFTVLRVYRPLGKESWA